METQCRRPSFTELHTPRSFLHSKGSDASTKIPAIGLGLFVRTPPDAASREFCFIETINAPSAGPLQEVVRLFHRRVRSDPALAPVFEDAIHDWAAHLNTLAAFWSSLMLTSGRYEGNPVAAHRQHQARMTPALAGALGRHDG